jgi:hypothetical protein
MILVKREKVIFSTTSMAMDPPTEKLPIKTRSVSTGYFSMI